MKSTRRKTIIATVLLLAVSTAGIFLMSGGRKQAFLNDVATTAGSEVPLDQGGEAGAVLSSDVAALPRSEEVGQPAASSTTERAAEKQVVEKETKTDAGKPGIAIADRLVSFGFEGRSSRDIDTVIVHSSYDALGNDPYSVSGVIAEYKQAGVSPHYLIDRKGTIYRLVEDRDVAYHAGVSKTPDGRSGVNAFSIGIEVIGKDTDSPTSAQYVSLRSLVALLKSKYHIKYVLGHSDIAPGRKTDPWGFDWKELKQ